MNLKFVVAAAVLFAANSTGPNSRGTVAPKATAGLFYPRLAGSAFRQRLPHTPTQSPVCVFQTADSLSPVGCGSPNPLLKILPHWVAALTPTWASTVAATATHSQPQLHANICSCPLAPHVPPTFSGQPCCAATARLISLPSSAGLMRHGGILK